jgi:outer membrane protein assembly factor BamB
MRYGKAVLLLCLGMLAASATWAVQTTFWQVGTFNDLLQGTLEGVSLTKDGELELAPDARTVFNPDETLALSLASDREHNLYIGTGDQGKVFRVGPDMKGSLFFKAEESDVFALAAGPDGAIYVATSPEGKIYRVTPDGKSKVFFDPKTKYIWALQFDKEGRLYAGTGDRGLILRIDPDGKGNVFFDSHQTHIMCLTEDASGNLLAGSVPNGLIYRISPAGKAFVLYKADFPEIHDLAVDAQGRIYAAALGALGAPGVPFQLAGPQPGAVVQGGVTTVTVTASGGDEAAGTTAAQKAPQASKQGASFNHPTAPAFGMAMPRQAQGHGALIRILPDYTAETIWTSNKESIFGLALHGSRVLFTTDEDGRIFQVNPNQDGQNLTLLAETHESLATRLLYRGDDLYVATSNIAKLIRVSLQAGREGTYESSVKDARFISKWGVLAWRGTLPQGSALRFYARSGNSDRPDPTWSDWSGPYTESDGTAIQCPPARYLQWKAVFQGSTEGSPVLDDVTISYLNQNLPPAIQSFNVSSAGERTGPTGVAPALSPGMSPGGTITVTANSQMSMNPPVQMPQPEQMGPTILTWQASDPNGDQLTYALYLKSADEKEWHLLKDKLHQTSFVLDPNALPDGKYVARLVASDAESNPPSTARQDKLESAPFWVDNTPPQVQVSSQSALPDGAEIHFKAEDETSPLRSAEISQDGKEWHDVLPDDGIADSRTETFTVRVRNLSPGEHVVILRAFDTAGNAGLGKALVQIPGAKTAGH